MNNNLFAITDQFSKLRVLVVGESILKSYVKGKADRLSLEAPAPVIHAGDIQEVPGGAANVAVNASHLGAEVTFLSVIGKDYEGETILHMLRSHHIGVDRVLRKRDRKTMLRRRVYADSRLLVRYDQGSKNPISEQTEDLLMEHLRELCPLMDVVILSDYGAGLLTDRLLEKISQMQSERPCVLVADTRRLKHYRSLQLAAIRPSYYSALSLLPSNNGNGHSNGFNNSNERLRKLWKAGDKILNMIDTQLVAITLDDDGALVFERECGLPSRAVYRTYADKMPFNRVDGAGDAFISGLALALAAGAQAPAAAEIASAAATLVVKGSGQATCCVEELKAYLSGDEKMVEDTPSIAERAALYRQQGKRVVFTNGCFDILHSAHVAYLNQAKSFGDVLVIGVNTDESVKRLKGSDRPINSLEERLKVLSGLSCVDHVVPFTEDTPMNLIKAIKPDVYVKGGDYTRESLPEASVVEGLGGEVRIVPYIENHSTTGVIERIRKLYAD